MKTSFFLIKYPSKFFSIYMRFNTEIIYKKICLNVYFKYLNLMQYYYSNFKNISRNTVLYYIRKT